MESNFYEALSQIRRKLAEENKGPFVHKILKDLYQIIQKCSKKVTDFFSLSVEEQNLLLSLVKYLMLIIADDAFTPESILLSSTCLSVLVAGLFEPEFASIYLPALYCYVGEITQGSCFNEDKEKKIFIKPDRIQEITSDSAKQSDHLNAVAEEFTQDVVTNSEKKIPTFHQVAILHGVLSCQKSDLFPYRSKFFNRVPFILTMYNPIHAACLMPGTSQYHAFNVLVCWLRMCEKLLPELVKTKTLFSKDSVYVDRILTLLASNWESPIKGVSTFVKEAYKILIAMSNTECGFVGVGDFSMAAFILEQVIDISWKTKGKYLVLSVVLQFVDYRKVLVLHPSLPHEVIFNLKAAYAASVISEVYKSVVLSMKDRNSSAECLRSEWAKYWMNPIKQALSCNDKLLVQTVCSYIVPWTFKTLPGSYELLLDSFSADSDFPQKLTLLRVAKESGICVLGTQEIDLIRTHLHHLDCHLRIHILTVLCSSTKKSKPLSHEELELVKEFIGENMNIDSTSFQQSFLSQLRILLVRVRDSLAQEYRVQSKNGSLSPSRAQLEFVDWLANTAVKNTFPGTCFQRRRLSLLTLNILFDVFITSPLGNNRKEKPSKFVEKLVEWAHSQGVWLFFKDDLVLNILPCLTDYTDEVRSTSFDLLVKFSHLPPVSEGKSLFDRTFLLQYSHHLCNHPDYRSNDGGAFLLCFVYRKMFFIDNKQETVSLAVNFLNDLVAKIRDQLGSAKKNFLTAAIQSPIHGFLLGLQYCLKGSTSELGELYRTEKENIVILIENINSLSNDIIDYMICVMKGNDEKEICPSFSDIGEALEKLVVGESETKNPASKEDVKESGSLPEVDLLLSCCWHSIKNSCFLLCDLSTFICDINMPYGEKESYLLNIAQKLSTVLIACRHRGVVEACSFALNKFCKKLLKDELLYESICKFLLNLVFASLLDASNTSVTRRSAGLPCLCQAVVTSEDNNIRRKLLSFTIEKLLSCISQPLPPVDQISDKTDLPQAHAYHILKVLVMDASLSQAILAHIDTIIPVCVSGFSSNLWPIRNGALQLFGVILPRICGQKKVRDDDSEHNLVSGSELFSRCPSLQTYLHEQLKKCVVMHHQKMLSSELVPVLSILSKLSSDPGEEDYIMGFKILLLELLDIPVWKIRDLVTSALSAMVAERDVINLMEEIKKELKSGSFRANRTHGCLLVIQKALKKDSNFFSNINDILGSLEDFYYTASASKCWIIIGLVLDLIEMVAHKSPSSLKLDGENLPQITTDDSGNIGYSLFESRVLALDFAKKYSDSSLPILPQKYFKNLPVITEYLKFMTKQLHADRNKKSIESSLESWKQVGRFIMEFLNANQHPSIVYQSLSFYVDLCSDWEVGSHVLDRSFTNCLEKFLWDCLDMKFGLSVAAISLSMLSLCIRAGLESWGVSDSDLEKWNMVLNSYSQPRSPDVKRMQAALSISHLGPQLVNYLEKRIQTGCEYSVLLLLGLCDSSILLLQDEDEEVRKKACEFPSNIPHQYKINLLQFNIGIKVLLEYMFTVLKDNNRFLFYLWNRLQNYPSTAKILRSTAKTMKMNLFEQEYVNVFAEPLMISFTHRKYIKMMLNRLFSKRFEEWKEKVNVFSSDVMEEIRDLLVIFSSESLSQLNQGFGHPHYVFLALKKLHCQVEILESQKGHASCDATLCAAIQSVCDSWKSVESHLTTISCWFINQL